MPLFCSRCSLWLSIAQTDWGEVRSPSRSMPPRYSARDVNKWRAIQHRAAHPVPAWRGRLGRWTESTAWYYLTLFQDGQNVKISPGPVNRWHCVVLLDPLSRRTERENQSRPGEPNWAERGISWPSFKTECENQNQTRPANDWKGWTGDCWGWGWGVFEGTGVCGTLGGHRGVCVCVCVGGGGGGGEGYWKLGYLTRL